MQKLTPEFIYMKGISIGTRVKRIAMLAAVGFILQLFVSPIVGWFFILAAALIGRSESKSNRPKITGEGDWQTVTVEELEKASKLFSDTSKISSGYTSSCSFGCLAAFSSLFVGLVLLFTVDGGNVMNSLSPVLSGGPLSIPFVVDILTFTVVILSGGNVAAWEPLYLRTKFWQMGPILATAKNNPQLEFIPSLLLAKTTKGSVPTDCKLLAKIKDADPNFIGIQVQVSFNQVQGQSLAYTYCVLLAKPEFHMTKRTEMIEMPPPGGFSTGILSLFADANQKRESQFARFSGSLIEVKAENEVDIVVVRQDTSANRGYATSPDEALEVFSDAFLLARTMLEDGKVS